MDRLVFAGLYRLSPTVLNALAILKLETVIKWHRAGFVGSAADPRRVAQARHRCRADERGQIYSQKTRTTVARLEDVPANHADGIAAMDLFVVPTISFRLLYGLLIMGTADAPAFPLAKRIC